MNKTSVRNSISEEIYISPRNTIYMEKTYSTDIRFIIQGKNCVASFTIEKYRDEAFEELDLYLSYDKREFPEMFL